MVLSTWICVLLIILPSLLINDYETDRKDHPEPVAVGIQVLVVGFAIIVYTLIGMRLLRQRRSTGRTGLESKTLKLTTAIVITYFLLEVIPSMLLIVLSLLLNCCHDVGKAYRQLFYLPSAFNTISNPIIYVSQQLGTFFLNHLC